MAIIAIMGGQGDGKDYLTDRLIERLPEGWEVKRFAEMPKRQCAEIMGVEWERFNDRSDPIKNAMRPLYAGHAEKLKDIYGSGVWAEALMRQYKTGSNWIINDLRDGIELESMLEYADKALLVDLVRVAKVSEWWDMLDLEFPIPEDGSDDRVTRADILNSYFAGYCEINERSEILLKENSRHSDLILSAFESGSEVVTAVNDTVNPSRLAEAMKQILDYGRRV